MSLILLQHEVKGISIISIFYNKTVINNPTFYTFPLFIAQLLLFISLCKEQTEGEMQK